MRRGTWIALPAFVLVLAAVACGGKKEASASGTGLTESAEAKVPATPEAMAEAIGDIYVETLTKVVDILKDRPEAAAVKPGILELKEKAVRRLVEIGRRKAKLSASGRAVVDSDVRLRINALPTSLFSAYQDAVNYFLSNDIELFNVLGSLNIITQYADLGLLKKQSPDEAKRLGIE